MGHLLATMNPEAAAEADRPPSHDGWQPAGPPLSEPAAPEVAAEPERAIEIGESARETLPLPSIGHMVVYHLRTGDSRNRRVKFPAVVMDADADARLLKLWVIVDDGDTWMQDLVPERVEPEPGWERVAPGQILEVPPGMMAEIAQQVGMLLAPDSLESRVAALEAKVAAFDAATQVPVQLAGGKNQPRTKQGQKRG